MPILDAIIGVVFPYHSIDITGNYAIISQLESYFK